MVEPLFDIDQLENNQTIPNISAKTIYYLKPFEVETLNWSSYSFNFPRMCRVGVIADGSCFFHAVAQSYYKVYRRGRLNDVVLDRLKFIRQLRLELASKLGDPVDEDDSESPSHYQIISRGEMESFGEIVPQYSLNSMKAELASDRPVDNAYNEFISDILNKDIYILDVMKKDIYVTGKDLDILYKGRESIVLLYIPGHYELVGIRNNNNDIKTLFSPDHPFIQSIQTRMMELISMGSEI
jgi:hypothetical protein